MIDPPQREPKLLRTFCTLQAIAYFGAAVLFSLARPLGGKLLVPLLAQEALGVLSLVCMAALLLWLRAVIIGGYVDQYAAVRRGRIVRSGALIVGAGCVMGLCAVVFGTSLGVSEKASLMMESVLVLIAVMFTYSGASRSIKLGR